MSKKIKIQLEETFDFQLIGLVTAEPIYKVSWQINAQFHILLKEANPVQVYHNKKQLVQEFSRFTFKTPDNLHYHLIHNKGTQGLFIEEQKQIDYWLMIEDKTLELKHLLTKLKNMKNISLALKIEPGSLKSKNRFIFPNEEEI